MGVSQQSPRKRRRRLDGVEGGAVGLGIIVAEMGAAGSGPILMAIVSRVASAFKLVEVERSECYTCIISHSGRGSSIRKKVHMEEDQEGKGGGGGGGEVVFFQSPVRVVEAPPVLLPVEGFLTHCSLCGKSLHGIDIFMYRGERAFCSAECRFQHMLGGDEHREKYCSSELLKPYEHSVSPCSAPVHLAAGIAAA